MILSGLKYVYRRGIAAVMLFTAETILTMFLFLASLIGFVAVAKYVFLDRKEDFDHAAFAMLEKFIADGLTSFMVFLGVLGNYQVMIAANLLLICYFLFIRKHRWYSIKIPAISLSSVLLMSLLKQFFSRPRPLIPLLETAKGFSFPSGHAMMSATFFGLLIYFIYKKDFKQPYKMLMILSLVVLILMIAISRVYLRVHYASDVIAGLALGIIWLTIAIKILNRIERYSRKEIQPVIEQSTEPAS